MAKKVKQQQEGTTGNEAVLLQKIAALENQLAHQGAESRGTGYLNQFVRKTTQYLPQKNAWHPTVQEVKKTKPFVRSTHLSTVGVFATCMSQKTKTYCNTTGPRTIDSTATYK